MTQRYTDPHVTYELSVLLMLASLLLLFPAIGWWSWCSHLTLLHLYGDMVMERQKNYIKD